MPSFTNKLGLIKAAGGEDVDVDQLNANFDRLDDNTSAKEVTSTTRPIGTDRYLGKIIYETDTKCLRIWDGANWAWLGGAAGKVGSGNGMTVESGWAGASETSGSMGHDLFEVGGGWFLDFAFRRSGAAIAVNANGLITGAPLLIAKVTQSALLAALGNIGPYGLDFGFFYRTTTGGTRSGQGRVRKNGDVEIIAGQPNEAIQQYTTSGEYSLIGSIFIPRAGI